MKFFKVTIPNIAAQSWGDEFTWFLNNYGSSAWIRTVEGDWVGEEQGDTVLEIMSSRREELEKIEPGLVRGMADYIEESGEEWTFEIVEFNLEEGEV